MNKFKHLIHVVLFSIYPVIFLFTRNVVEVNFLHVLLPLFIVLLLALAIFFISDRLIKNPIKSSFITSLLMIFILNGNLIYQLTKLHILAFSITSIVIIGLLCVFIIKKKYDGNKLVNILNYFSSVLIILCLISVPADMYKNLFKKTSIKSSNVIQNNHPDIYYIVLDGYANNKALKEYYNYDNSEFLTWLENKGFFVAENSTSNYMCTTYSITSSLNMRYINDDLQNTHNMNTNAFKLVQLRRENEVVKFLKSKGYRFLFLDVVKNDMLSDLKSIADIEYTNNEFNFLLTSLNYLIYKNSIIGLLDLNGNFIEEKFINIYFYNSYKNSLIKRLEFLSHPEKIAREPKFIYAHFLTPHPPYLFNRTGKEQPEHIVEPSEYATEWLKKDLYVDYLMFTNEKIKELITSIIKNSKKPPIIIIQSDHGSHYHFQKTLLELKEQSIDLQKNQEKYSDMFLSDEDLIINSFGILNAYYFPGEKNTRGLYETITPVNSFKVLFNNYFNTGLELYEDKNYFGFYECTFGLPDVTDKLKNN
ncbi:MAG: hypothetical protein A2Y25_02680 [Candidatus Melainabacteria bacterium GWF2_37_15]|nr:MAG: hypothetical protein A2Y25_02680 [Candidatus Melainabacteria bacterium GWF2_37_15]